MVQHSNPSRPPEPLTVILRGCWEGVRGGAKKHKCHNFREKLHVYLCVLWEKCFKLDLNGKKRKKQISVAPGEGAEKKVSEIK